MSVIHPDAVSINATLPTPTSTRALLAAIEMRLRTSPVLTEADEAGALDREAREILAVLLNISPGEVSRRSDEHVTSGLAMRASAIAERRANGEPLAYCLGSAAFRHLVLQVDPRVLIPRPETEIVVDEVLRITAGRQGGIAVDIGTGSGAIALSLATEGRFDSIIATDVSPEALEVAELNARALSTPHCPVEFRCGGDFGPLRGVTACVLVSNPPYIAFDEAPLLPASVRDWEPALALFAERGGMARYEVLLAEAPAHLEPAGWLVLEVDARRGQETASRATQSGLYANVRLVHDLAGRDRVLVAQVRSDIHPE